MTRTYAIDARTVDRHFPGIARYVSNLLRAIVTQLQPHERIAFFCDHNQRAELGLPESEQVSWLEATASPFGFAQQWQIPRLLKAHGVHVYHSPYYLMPYRPGVPTVLTVYDLIPMLYPQLVSLQARLLFRLTTRLALRSADRVIAISQATREDYLSYFSLAAEHIRTIHLAASAAFRPADEAQMREVQREYDLSQPYVLYVGSNKPHKNLMRLVQAWSQIPASIRDAHTLVLAGRRDPRYPQLEQEIARLGLSETVRQIQDVTDAALPALYSNAELFVFPSLYEGFGLPVLEAMSCGTAVACADRSSLPEIVENSAVLFDPQETISIAEAIADLLVDSGKRKQLRQKALQRSSDFSWEHTAVATLAVYRDL